MSQEIRYAFWGSDEFSINVLKTLIGGMFKPIAIISVPDMPKGRKKIITPTPLREFAREHNIECLTPEDLRSMAFDDEYRTLNLDVAIVASYGKIIPDNLLDIPKRGTLNVHPSLLPLWRGSSPIQNSIIHDELAGVSIMLLDEKMDHGPLLDQKERPFINPDLDPIPYEVLRDELAIEGGKMLLSVLPKWIEGRALAQPQDHSSATFSKILKKSDGKINLDDNPFVNLRKIRALNPWPGTFFIHKKDSKDIRVKVLSAHIENNKLVIEKVIPEGKSEMDWKSFERGYMK